MSAQAMTKRVSTWPVAVHQMVRRLLRWGKGLPGLWRLRHRVLNFETLRFPEQAIKAKLSYGPHLWVRPNDPIGRAIFYDGHWELAVISQFAAALRPGDVVLDVGANIGQFAIVAASKVGPSMTGMRTSHSTRSKRRSSSRASASTPCLAPTAATPS